MGEKIYGKNAVRECLATGRGGGGTLYTCREDRKEETQRLEKAAQENGVRLVAVPRREMDRLARGGNHQGLILELPGPAARAGDWQEELKAVIDAGGRPRVAMLDRIQDPGNLGAIVRSAAQFGFDHVFFSERESSPFSPAARKTACGGDQHVAVVSQPNLTRTLEQLQEIGFWIGAACMDGTPLWEVKFDAPFAIIMGSEGEGVRRLLAEKSDVKIAIPSMNRLDSLNVSVAAAIMFHEVYRYDALSTAQ